MEVCINALSKKIKCRNSLVGHLYSLLADVPMFKSIFVHGNVSSGKSFIIKKVLEYLGYNISMINCLEHSSSRSLLEKIILDLSKTKLSKSNGYKLPEKCDNLVDFIYQIKAIIQEYPDQPVVIVFEKCEKFRDGNSSLMNIFLRLGELTASNVCTIFTSDVIWEKFRTKIGEYEPILVHFPPYTKMETKEILFHLTKPDNYEEVFYSDYLNLFLQVYYRFCRDLNELRYMANKNFIKYIEPIETRAVQPDDKRSLWQNVQSTFKSNLEVLYLRMSTDDFDQQAKLSNEIESTTKLALSFELPYYAKFLLIAAFLASYNPQIEDRRLFSKQGGTRKKRSYKRKNQAVKVMRTHEGPKSFPLTRMIAIFCSIIDERIEINAILMTQLPTMCRLGLVSIIDDSNIDEPKYKCCVNFQFIMTIAKNMGFELKRYLHDFAY